MLLVLAHRDCRVLSFILTLYENVYLLAKLCGVVFDGVECGGVWRRSSACGEGVEGE